MLTLRQKYKSFGGYTEFYEHQSQITNSLMRFSVYKPKNEQGQKKPVLFWLSGLTCTDENFMQKAGAQKFLAESGFILVAPDTSPRNLGLPGEEDSWSFGSGAGFYLDALCEPWCQNYKMYSYVSQELPKLIEQHFGVDSERMSVMGHSMGGHGALLLGLRNSKRFRSISAFAPICAASRCPWGQYAFSRYLGEDRELWNEYDASFLLAHASEKIPILIDQGTEDEFLKQGQLMTSVLEEFAGHNDYPIQINMREGYDHSYYFISTFLESHIRFHEQYLS